MQQWIALKAMVQSWSGISNDALHVLASVPLLVLIALLLGRPIWSLLCWAVLLVMELTNEAVTGFADGRLESWEMAGSARDVPLVMAVPTILLLAARLFPQLLAARKAPIEAAPIWYQQRREIIDAEFEEVS